ncbi:MAG: hypothetical protein L6R42_005809 [Xanthoria sp. 1 TBL-2021]|nr:MAG: hypothetical protein L6R42_005809 [Xanthoria sp. 1 TBL-2021]
MLYQAEHAELEDDSGVRVRSVWDFGDVDQSGAGHDKDHSNFRRQHEGVDDLLTQGEEVGRPSVIS